MGGGGWELPGEVRCFVFFFVRGQKERKVNIQWGHYDVKGKESGGVQNGQKKRKKTKRKISTSSWKTCRILARSRNTKNIAAVAPAAAPNFNIKNPPPKKRGQRTKRIVCSFFLKKQNKVNFSNSIVLRISFSSFFLQFFLICLRHCGSNYKVHLLTRFFFMVLALLCLVVRFSESIIIYIHTHGD